MIGSVSIGATAIGGFNQPANFDVTVSLVGVQFAAFAGSVGATVGEDVFVSLTGAQMAMAAGNVATGIGPGSDVTLPLTGQTMVVDGGSAML